MTSRAALSVIPVAAVVLVSALLSSAVATGAVATTPAPTTAAISVIIPELSPSPTSTSTSSGGNNGGNSGGNNGGNSGGNNGGNSGGNSGGGTNPDGSPKPPAKPGKNKPGLILDRETVEAHQFMIARASGYAAGEKVQLVLYPGAVVVGSFLADASGEFSARFRVPDDTRPGAHVAEATGWVSGFVANEDFLVTTTVLAAGVPLLWWVMVVLAVLLMSAISLLVYFRQSIHQWFGGAVAPQGSTP